MRRHTEGRMSQQMLRTTVNPFSDGPNNRTLTTPWRLDLSPEAEDDLLIAVSIAVFGFPALVIVLICLLRLRVYYIDKRDRKLGRHRTIEESSLLAPEESVCRGSRVDIKLSTINENAREEDGTFENQDVDDCAGSGVTSKNIVVSLESQSCANGKVAL